MKDKLRLGINARYTSSGVKQGGLVDEIVRQIEDYDLDMYLGPEFLFVEELGVDHVYDKSEKDEIFSEIAGRLSYREGLYIPGTMVWHEGSAVFNTAPIIVEGKITEYEKRSDAGSTYNAIARGLDNVYFWHGEEDLIMNWKNYRLGISICADRQDLADHIKNEKLPLLDFYFLTSCGVSLYKPELPVKEGGFGICSNGDLGVQSEVLYVKESFESVDELNPDETIHRIFEPSTIDISNFSKWQLDQHKLDESRREKDERLDIYELDVRCLKKN